MRAGKVFFNGLLCGRLTENGDGIFTFSYLPSYLESQNAHAVSLTLPLQKEPFVSKTLFPFFDGLIPEGWLLSLTASTLKLNITDRMGLLLLTSRDSIGAVTVEEDKDA